MLSEEKEQQEIKNKKGTDANLLKLVTGVKKLAETDRFASWLGEHTILGNLLIAFLTIYSGYNLVDTFAPEAIPTGYSVSKITEDNLNDVCMSKSYYESQFPAEVRKGVDITPLGLQYRNDLKDVLPVFRWACRYSFDDPSVPSIEVTGSGAGPSLPYRDIGLSLDEHHCAIQYAGLGRVKATYLNYKDRHSWVCTDVNPSL